MSDEAECTLSPQRDSHALTAYSTVNKIYTDWFKRLCDTVYDGEV